MSVLIKGVIEKTPAYKKFKENDILLQINGHDIKDVLDYMYYAAEAKLEVLIEREGKQKLIKVKKSEYDDLGLEFETFLMDKKQSCTNKCIFCFIDQMPEGLRDSLYFKDDDARLSFLHGNYITLTNISDEDIKRIIDMRLNINVSVHTTNPELRCKMMNNRFAGEKLKYLKMMTDSGLVLNCQVVCCPGINDKDELRRTISDIGKLMPNITSLAIVPVGLTKYRENLTKLEPFDEQSACEVIDIVEEYQKKFLSEYGRRMVFASDEFYILAKKELPSAEEYEDYPQYENGLGLLRSLIDEFDDALTEISDDVSDRKCTIATGVLAYPYICDMARKAMAKWKNIEVDVVKIENEFFGKSITVAGLITATDLINALKGKELGDELLIPSVMLSAGDHIFIDDYTVEDVEKSLNTKIRETTNNGYELLCGMLGIDDK